MGFLDTKTKAAKLDQMQQAEYANDKAAAQMAREYAAEQAAMRQQMQRAKEAEMIRKAGQDEGLAAGIQHGVQKAYNSLFNTPNGMPGYKMPSAGDTNMKMYQRPVPQEQGLWSTLLQKAGVR